MRVPRRVREPVRDVLVKGTRRFPGLVKAIVHDAGTPSLFALSSIACSWSTNAETFLENVPGESSPQDLAEGREVFARISPKNTSGLPYPDFYGVEAETSAFLYAAVRRVKPEVMVESGVANGVSTAMILAAMEANGTGELHSTDISADVGVLVENRSRWHLHVVDPEHLRRDLERLRDELPRVDVFQHDGEHSYRTQMTEYETFWPALPAGGLLLSDDVDFSYAFRDFAHHHELKPAILLDTLKLYGMVVKA
jgi:predicted O-methyltransferase YrrM